MKWYVSSSWRLYAEGKTLRIKADQLISRLLRYGLESQRTLRRMPSDIPDGIQDHSQVIDRLRLPSSRDTSVSVS